MVRKVIKLAVVFVAVLLWAVPAGAYSISGSTIHTDSSSDTVYTGISAISDGRVVISFNHAGSLGKALRFMDVSASSASSVGGSINTNTSNDLYDVAYIGFNGTEEMLYVNRDSSSDVFEYWWNPSTYVGTYKGVVSKYSSGSNFPGMDREFGGTADDLLMTTTTRLYHVDGSGGSATYTTFYGPVGDPEFSGITGLGDINSDGMPDYAVSRNLSGSGRFYIVESNNGSYSLGTAYAAAGSRLYNGIANLGDPDGDGFVELIVASTNADGSGKGYLQYYQTDITYVPEPATVCILGIGAIALIRKKH